MLDTLGADVADIIQTALAGETPTQARKSQLERRKASYDGAPSLPANVVSAAADEIDQQVLDTLGADVADLMRAALAGETPTQARKNQLRDRVDIRKFYNYNIYK